MNPTAETRPRPSKHELLASVNLPYAASGVLRDLGTLAAWAKDEPDITDIVFFAAALAHLTLRSTFAAVAHRAAQMQALLLDGRTFR